MGARGPKPGFGVNAAQVNLKLPTAMKEALARRVALRRLRDPSLPLTWGVSDYLRQLIAAHLASTPEEPAE